MKPNLLRHLNSHRPPPFPPPTTVKTFKLSIVFENLSREPSSKVPHILSKSSCYILELMNFDPLPSSSRDFDCFCNRSQPPNHKSNNFNYNVLDLKQKIIHKSRNERGGINWGKWKEEDVWRLKQRHWRPKMVVI
jgi:hypothetical protein